MGYKQRQFDIPVVIQPDYRSLLAHVRGRLGYGSAKALANHLGLSKTAIDRISRGKTKVPTAETGWALQSIAIDLFGETRAREIWEGNCKPVEHHFHGAQAKEAIKLDNTSSL